MIESFEPTSSADLPDEKLPLDVLAEVVVDGLPSGFEGGVELLIVLEALLLAEVLEPALELSSLRR